MRIIQFDKSNVHSRKPRIVKIISFAFILFVISTLVVISVMGAQPSGETGLDVKLMNVYNLDLISYGVSSKYHDYDNKFIVLEIIALDENSNIHYMNWIMKDDKYQDLKEKI